MKTVWTIHITLGIVSLMCLLRFYDGIRANRLSLYDLYKTVWTGSLFNCLFYQTWEVFKLNHSDWLITMKVSHMIPNKKLRAARGGSARTNALAIDQMISNALNKQNQTQKQRKKKNLRNINLRSAQLNLHTGQRGSEIGTSFFNVLTGTTPGGVRVRGRELIKSIAAGVGGVFTIENFLLQPGSFPRLDSYGSLYEMFIFHSAKIIFQSNQPTTSSGIVGIAVDYDCKDSAALTSMQELMRNISSSMSNVYANQGTLVEKRLSRLPRYLCASDSSPDVNQESQARVLIASEGLNVVSDDPVVLGYIFIEYDVEFFTPQ